MFEIFQQAGNVQDECAGKVRPPLTATTEGNDQFVQCKQSTESDTLKDLCENFQQTGNLKDGCAEKQSNNVQQPQRAMFSFCDVSKGPKWNTVKGSV